MMMTTIVIDLNDDLFPFDYNALDFDLAVLVSIVKRTQIRRIK